MFLLIIQAVTVLFAVYCAFLNEVAVVKMIQNGASLNEEKQFHMANAAVKIIYAAAITYAVNVPLLDRVIIFHLLLLIQWMVFDIALNLCLKKTWDYIGDTAQIDKLLVRGFFIRVLNVKIKVPGLGSWAGEVKAAFCLVVIISLNLLLSIL